MRERAITAFVGLIGAIALSAIGCDRGRQMEAAASEGQTSATTSPSSAAGGGIGGSRPTQEPGKPSAGPTPPTLPSDRAVLGTPAVPAARFVQAITGEPILRSLVLDSHLLVERDVGVMARRDGVIETVEKDRGAHVREGDILATLERGDLKLSEKAALLELEKENSSFGRAGRLFEQGIVPKEDFEQARLRRDSAEKLLERIRYDLTTCMIRAPFNGVVSGRFVEKGQVIQEDDRRVLFQVTALGPLLARVYVPEWALHSLSEGQKAAVTPSAGLTPEASDLASVIEARIRWINDVLDAASGSVEMLVEVVGGPGSARLRPGVSVKVRLDLPLTRGAALSSVVSLPREALPAGELAPGQTVELKILRPDGSIDRRAARLGWLGDGRVQIRQGLAAGEKVILD